MNPVYLYGGGAALLWLQSHRRQQEKDRHLRAQLRRDTEALVRTQKEAQRERAPFQFKHLTDDQIEVELIERYGFSSTQVDEFLHGYHWSREKKKTRPMKPLAREELSLEWPEWLTWDLVSWDTLSAAGDYLWEEWVSWKGLAAVGAAVLIGPEILAYYGLTYGVAEMTAFDTFLAAMNAKDLIDAASRGVDASVAVFTGQLWEAFLSGGPQGSFLRQLMGGMVGSNIAYTIEHQNA